MNQPTSAVGAGENLVIVSSRFGRRTAPHSTQQTTHSLSARLFSGLLRLVAIATGTAILAASTSTVIAATKLTGPEAHLMAALAAGVAVGAIVVPRAPVGLALALVAALLAGEAFNLLGTAERVIANRDAQAAAVTNANDARQAAFSRLSRAEAALVDQNNRAALTAAQPGCARECRTLLESQATKLEAEIREARGSLAAAPPAKSATPLADRLGLAPWLLDLIVAGLLSVGANGLAAVLIAWGARPAPAPGAPGQRAPNVPHVNALNSLSICAPTCPNPAPLTIGAPVAPAGNAATCPTGIAVSTRTQTLLTIIAGHGGAWRGSQRDLADRAGLSKGGLGRALQELRDAGVLEVQADKAAGTIVRMSTL